MLSTFFTEQVKAGNVEFKSHFEFSDDCDFAWIGVTPKIGASTLENICERKRFKFRFKDSKKTISVNQIFI